MARTLVNRQFCSAAPTPLSGSGAAAHHLIRSSLAHTPKQYVSRCAPTISSHGHLRIGFADEEAVVPFDGPMNEDRLKQLFSRVAACDEAAESELFAELRPRLNAIGFSRGVASADLEDVVQECLAAVFSQLRRGNFKALSSPSTWVIGILLNKIVDHFRKLGRSDAILAAAAEHAVPSSGQISRFHRDARLEVFDVLRRLTSVERFVLTGTELAGLTYEEIANRLNCPTGTIASTKHRAVRKFREMFRRGHPPSPQLEGGEDGDV